MSAREKLRARVRALLEKTPARGCTEAEAIAAAEKAAKLMREHGLTEAELTVDERSSRASGGIRSVKARLWPVIAWCTNTSEVHIRDQAARHRVAFVGTAPGPDIAVYLRDVCERATDAALARFKASRSYRRRSSLKLRRAAAEQFALGFVDRLRYRLAQIFGPQVDPEARDRADKALAQLYPEMRLHAARDSKISARNWRARAEGFRAADDVHLAAGVGGASEPKRIGGAS